MLPTHADGTSTTSAPFTPDAIEGGAGTWRSDFVPADDFMYLHDVESDAGSTVFTPSSRPSRPLSPVAVSFTPSDNLNTCNLTAIERFPPTPAAQPRIYHSNPSGPTSSTVPHSPDRVARNLSAIRSLAPAAGMQPRSDTWDCSLPSPPPVGFPQALTHPPPPPPAAPTAASGLSATHTTTEDRLQKLEKRFESMYDVHSRQLADVHAENDKLHSMLNIHGGILSDYMENVRQLGIRLEDQASDLQEQFTRASRELERARVEARVSQGKQNVAKAPSPVNDNTREMQKMQSMTITAIVGQVGALDFSLRTTNASHVREIEKMTKALYDQAERIKGLEQDHGNADAMISALRERCDAMSKELDNLKSHGFTADSADCKYSKKTTKMVKNQSIRFRVLDDEVERLSGDIKEVKDDISDIQNNIDHLFMPGNSPSMPDACATKVNEISTLLNDVKADAQQLRADVSSIQKRVEHRTASQDAAMDRTFDGMSDLAKRMDEAVALNDTNRTTLNSKVTKLTNDVAVIKAHASRDDNSQPSKTVDELFALREEVPHLSQELHESQESLRCMNEKTHMLQTKMIELDTEARTIARKELNEVRDSLATCMMDLGLKIKQSDARFVTEQAAVSGAALDDIKEELAEVCKTTRTLKKTCELLEPENETLIEGVASMVAREVNKAYVAQKQETSKVECALQELDQRFVNPSAVQDSKIAATTEHACDQMVIKRSVTTIVNGLLEAIAQANATQINELSRLSNPIDGMAKKHSPALATLSSEQSEIKNAARATSERISAMDDHMRTQINDLIFTSLHISRARRRMEKLTNRMDAVGENIDRVAENGRQTSEGNYNGEDDLYYADEPVGW